MINISLGSFENFRVSYGGSDRLGHKTEKIKNLHVHNKYLETIKNEGQLSPYNVAVIKVSYHTYATKEFPNRGDMILNVPIGLI